MNNFEIIASFPAYDVVQREVKKGLYYKGAYRSDVEYTVITTEDRLGMNHKGVHREYSAGSVVSYAMEKGYCPIDAIEKAVANKHKLHWINASGASIVSHNRPRWILVEVNVGMVVLFEGRLFTITSEPNNNLGLAPLEF